MYYTYYVLRSFMHMNDNSRANHMNFKPLYSLSRTLRMVAPQVGSVTSLHLGLLLENGGANSTFLAGL